jgi:hypothetical protein
MQAPQYPDDRHELRHLRFKDISRAGTTVIARVSSPVRTTSDIKKPNKIK